MPSFGEGGGFCKYHALLGIIFFFVRAKSHQFFLVTYPNCLPSFVWIGRQLFEIFCSQTDEQEKDVVQSMILAKSTPLSKVCHGYIKLSNTLRLKLRIFIKAQVNRMKIDYFSDWNLWFYKFDLELTFDLKNSCFPNSVMDYANPVQLSS